MIRDVAGRRRGVGRPRSATSTRATTCAAPAAPLRLAVDEGALDDDFAVLYGDSYLPIDFAAVWRAFADSGRADALMTVFRNDGPVGREQCAISRATAWSLRQDGADPAAPACTYIDYGLSIIDRERSCSSTSRRTP